MTPADVVAVGAFFAIVVAGLIMSSLRDLLRRQPRRRIQERMRQVDRLRAARQATVPVDAGGALFERTKDYSAVQRWFQQRVQRIRTVSGASGMRIVCAGGLVGGIAAFVIVWFAPLPWWTHPLVYAALPLGMTRLTYRFLIARFRAEFLLVFPDTLDLIIRAVRAGIPAVQAISTAGQEADEPVRSTFRTMGDSLRLGADLNEVLDKAVARVQIADFSFFAVCLLLQRETGGNLGETLENLSTIIRTRRDIRLKTRALTAEGRIASKIIASVPFAITGFLYVINRPYVDLLFHTRAGHKMLMLAAVLLVVGLSLIQKISKLDTSR
ncbi:Type II secretion system protein [Paraburkholderia piptadeniae]|uniref:Type II secretion system protein n=1 Tax=Paraburkholderia piptadeniae TaxID=1701573 RepID=A0A1N7RPT4_9BURK|nr:type II secretion system F family protein [Paraburkholderia piptadeniae]SIT37059.1 Type II secretion system protein [Paraburkholderia piptadeniae]